MRNAVAQLVALGKFPSEATASASSVQVFESLLMTIDPPLTKDEALAVLDAFGDDSSFGLAWSLLHLVETTPGWPYVEAHRKNSNPWVKLMLDRAG